MIKWKYLVGITLAAIVGTSCAEVPPANNTVYSAIFEAGYDPGAVNLETSQEDACFRLQQRIIMLSQQPQSSKRVEDLSVVFTIHCGDQNL